MITNINEFRKNIHSKMNEDHVYKYIGSNQDEKLTKKYSDYDGLYNAHKELIAKYFPGLNENDFTVIPRDIINSYIRDRYYEWMEFTPGKYTVIESIKGHTDVKFGGHSIEVCQIESSGKYFIMDLKSGSHWDYVLYCFPTRMENEVLTKQSKGTKEPEINEGLFYRLPNKVIGNQVYSFAKGAQDLYDSLSRGVDIHPAKLDQMLKELEEIKSKVKSFTSIEEVPTEYKHTK